MADRSLPAKVRYFFLGILAAVLLAVLTGAYAKSESRYRLSAWAGEAVGYGVYVLDTYTGEVRIAFQYTGQGSETIDNFHRTFENMAAAPQVRRGY